jgi:hypothetical protein
MPTTFILDASNLAHIFAAASTPSLERLLRVTQRIEDLWGEGTRIVTIADASLKWKLPKEDRPAFDKLVAAGKVVVAPSGHQADEYVFGYAREKGDVIVVSNDQYNDWSVERVGIPLLRFLVLEDTVLFRRVEIYVKANSRPVGITLPSGAAPEPPSSVSQAVGDAARPAAPDAALAKPPPAPPAASDATLAKPPPPAVSKPSPTTRQKEAPTDDADDLKRVIRVVEGILAASHGPLDIQAIEYAARSFYPTFSSWLERAMGGSPEDRLQRLVASRPDRFALVDLNGSPAAELSSSTAAPATQVVPLIAPNVVESKAPKAPAPPSPPPAVSADVPEDAEMIELIRSVVAAAPSPIEITELNNKLIKLQPAFSVWLPRFIPIPKTGRLTQFFKQREGTYRMTKQDTKWFVEVRAAAGTKRSKDRGDAPDKPLPPERPAAPAVVPPPPPPPAAPPPLLAAPAAPHALLFEATGAAESALETAGPPTARSTHRASPPPPSPSGTQTRPPPPMIKTAPPRKLPPTMEGQLLEWKVNERGRGEGLVFARGLTDNVLVYEQHVLEADRPKMRPGVYVHFRPLRIGSEIHATEVSVVGAEEEPR